MSHLGERLKSLREKNNKSQLRVAKDLGLSNVQLSRYESGDRKPDPEIIASFAEYYEVSTDYLLGLVDSPKSPRKAESVKIDETDNVFFFNLEGLTEEDRKEVEKYIELLKLRAKQFNDDSKKNN